MDPQPPIKPVVLDSLNDLPAFIVETFETWKVRKWNASNGLIKFDWNIGYSDLKITEPGYLQLGLMLRWRIMKALKQANEMQVLERMNGKGNSEP